MPPKPVIALTHVSKSFRMQRLRATSLKAAVIGMLTRVPEPRYEALCDVGFEVREGETVGIIGSNGSGKSTVLKLITGIIRPTSGRVEVSGRISPLIELGAGFHPDFTGRENIYLNGAILGVSRKVIDAAFEEIIDFSGIREFIDQPVKTYSSGMHARLGFAIAVHVNSDILVVDEVLAVGDEAFQQKCLARVQALRQAGKTILLVAHDQKAVAAVCDRVIWLEKGVIRMEGPTDEVLAAYKRERAPEGPAHAVRLETLALLDGQGRPLTAVSAGEPLTAHFTWRAERDDTVSWVLSLRRVHDGCLVAGADGPTCALAAGETGRGTFTTTLGPLAAGEYEVSIAPRGDAARRPAGPIARVSVASPWAGPAVSRLDGDWALQGAAVRS
jgi:ABC-type polysaccharide/polyol phosphate transport system ATPase subunit